MEYISVKDAATKFGISERRVQKLCEESRIDGAQMISNVWIIPSTAEKPFDERIIMPLENSDALSLNDLCNYLSISTATGRNWLKLDKLRPTEYHKSRPFFSRTYCEELKASIQSGKSKVLKSRRNKKYVSGSYLYKDYVSENSKNLQVVQNLLEEIELTGIDLSELYLRALVAECALQLFQQKYFGNCVSGTHLLQTYLDDEFSPGKYSLLIKDLIAECDLLLLREIAQTSFFDYQYVYEESEDIVGLLYISCKNIAYRKATGAYYTPTRVVKKLIADLSESSSFETKSRILDPCCGSGNFLLQLPHESVENIFGIDIDEISIKLTRINMALKFPRCSIDALYNNFKIADFYYFSGMKFDYIIGNPPWGFDYSEDEKKFLRGTFNCAKGKTVESYDLFIEQSLKRLNVNGSLSFVLPEAILNVKIHQHVREMILNGNSIRLIYYLGNVFNKVQCPCIILQVQHTELPFDTSGMRIKEKDNSFTIHTSRKVSSEYFSFTMQDDEYSVLQKILTLSDTVYLKNNAIFALGLVTGNNKKYISNDQKTGYETVLKGAEILKYRKVPSGHYLLLKPEDFQQVAPVEYYRASEKLLYRFICNQLVFAYDDEQTLSLNSCNILIPEIDDLEIKYIMAILNSRIAQFVFSKRFQSVKVLRSHIEEIPLPVPSIEKQEKIIYCVDELMSTSSNNRIKQIYEKIDKMIGGLFNLSDNEYNLILRSQQGENNFLL